MANQKLDKLTQARSRLLIKHPFFATLVLNTDIIPEERIPTAATDGVKIYYNPQFFEALSVDHVMFVLAHEVMHIALYHCERVMGRIHKKWNYATDYVINWMLKKEGFAVLECALLERKYGDHASEVVYDMLPDPPPPPPGGGGQCDEGQPGGGTTQAGNCDGVTDGDAPGTPGNMPDEKMGGDLLPYPTNDPDEIAKERQKIKQKISQAATNARMAGSMSAGIERIVEEILDPKVPWEDLLRDYMTRLAYDDEDWTVRDRRFTDVILPAMQSETHMGRVGFIVDTSGSVTDKELAQVSAELTSISEDLRPEGILVVWADTEVAGEQEYEVGDELKPMGGGGTDMRVPLAHMEQYDDLDVVVMVTDGYTPWPKVEPPYPLIVVCTTDREVPVGSVVRMH